MPLLKQGLEGLLHVRQRRRIVDLDDDKVQGVASIAAHHSKYPALGARQGNEDHVVLVTAHRALPLFVKQADDREGYVADTERFADDRTFRKELLGNYIADDGDLGTRLKFVSAKRPTALDRPFSRDQIVRIDAGNEGRPVL